MYVVDLKLSRNRTSQQTVEAMRSPFCVPPCFRAPTTLGETGGGGSADRECSTLGKLWELLSRSKGASQRSATGWVDSFGF